MSPGDGTEKNHMDRWWERREEEGGRTLEEGQREKKKRQIYDPVRKRRSFIQTLLVLGPWIMTEKSKEDAETKRENRGIDEREEEKSHFG